MKFKTNIKTKPEIRNKSKEKGFKKIILSFWFWMIIALVSYIIFVLVPIQWNESGYGWNTWEGVNLYKTVFAYISAFAFLIALILLAIYTIKYIQKSSLGDYWKISFTIIGIVLIIIFVFFYIKQYTPTEFDKDKFVKESLEEQGYEVIYNYYSELTLNETWASVQMKSLGNKNKQAWDGLIALSIYKNATRYIISILTPTEECFYSIDGNIYRALLKSNKEKVYSTNGIELDSTTLYNYINSEIETSSERCS